jgi:hypothetical protein
VLVDERRKAGFRALGGSMRKKVVPAVQFKGKGRRERRVSVVWHTVICNIASLDHWNGWEEKIPLREMENDRGAGVACEEM